MSLKEKLHSRCIEIVQERIISLEQELKELLLSQSNETKSSAGDKYETAREMINLEKNKIGARLEEASKMRSFLTQINPAESASRVKTGALISTDRGNYYLATSLGSLEIDGEKYFVVSPVSPIGQAMLDLGVGESFEVNKVRQTIQSIE